MARSRNPMSTRMLLRGSLIRFRRKCGKPSCHCADGAPHETPALSYSVGGSTRILTLRAEDLRTVQAAVARYKNAVAALDREALAGIQALRRRIEQEKARARRRGR